MSVDFSMIPEDLTKSEAHLLDYIQNHTDEFMFSSIGDISAHLGISVATVSRFVRHMGFADFKDLKRYLAKANYHQGPAAKMKESMGDRFSIDDWLASGQYALDKTREGLDHQAFEQALKAIEQAHRVFIHGKSASASMAELLMFRLRRLGIETMLLPRAGSEIVEGLAQVKKDDLVIMFSFSKLSHEGQMILACQKELGYRTLAFVGRRFIPEKECADIQLYVYRGEPNAYHSMGSAACLIDGLIVALSTQMGQRSTDALEKVHQLKLKLISEEER